MTPPTTPALPHGDLHLAEADRYAAVVRDADPQTPVPTCPDWPLGTLTKHVGRGERWAAAIVERRAEEFVPFRSVEDMEVPDGPGAAADWARAGSTRLAAAVAEAGPETVVWTFTGPQPASWWLRRRLHEIQVHRADAELALGLEFASDPAVAADGVSELLDLLAARPAADPVPLGEGRVLHAHATEDGLGPAGEWTVRATEPGRVAWEHGHEKGDVAVRGPAVALLLLLTRRRPPSDERLAVFGDPGVLDAWLEGTRF